MAYTPQEIEEIPKNLSNIFSDLELKIMEDLILRIEKNGELTGTAEWDLNRLIQMGESVSVIKKYVSTTLDLSFSEIENIFNDVLETGYNKDKNLFLAAGADFIPYKENKELQQLVEAVKVQTKDSCKNITNTMGFVKQVEGKQTFKPLTQYYKETLDRAAVEITTGSFSYGQTLKRVVNEMTNSGVRTIDYASGRSSRIEVAARRALQTSVTQITSHVSEKNMEALGTDIVEVSWHSTARPTHQVWQGRLFKWNKTGNNIGLSESKQAGNKVEYNEKATFNPSIEELNDEINNAIASASKRVAEAGSKDGYEHMELINLKTGKTEYEDCTQEEGQIGNGYIQYAYDHPQNEYIVVHNHNIESPLSEPDVVAPLSAGNISYQVVAQNDGIMYYAKKTNNIPSGFYPDMTYEKELSELNAKSRSGIITPVERAPERERIITECVIRDFYSKGEIRVDTRR